MKKIMYRDAISSALAEEMRRDEKVFVMGEDVAITGGVYKATRGLLEEFGPQRVRNTPLSEIAIAGVATGAAMAAPANPGTATTWTPTPTTSPR